MPAAYQIGCPSVRPHGTKKVALRTGTSSNILEFREASEDLGTFAPNLRGKVVLLPCLRHSTKAKFVKGGGPPILEWAERNLEDLKPSVY